MTRTGGLQNDNKKQELPDAKKHQQISFIKSSIRIVGYILIPVDFISASLVLIIR